MLTIRSICLVFPVVTYPNQADWMVRLIKANQSLYYLPFILMRSNTRGSKVNAIALIKSHPAGAPPASEWSKAPRPADAG